MMMPKMTMANFGSSIAGYTFVWAVIRQYLPNELQQYLENLIRRLMGFTNPYITMSIYEFTGNRLMRSADYVSVEAYLSEKSSKNMKKLKVETNRGKLVLSMDDQETCTDVFQGAQISWSLNTKGSPTAGSVSYPPEKRYYMLKFHKRYRELITDTYLPHVLNTGKAIRKRKRQRMLYTNSAERSRSTMWSHIVFEHPASFESLAMDPTKKKDIVDDLLHFSKSKDYYEKIGKPWKRGYLLHGPPGTGKSTMIAAMAKLLDYDVYDLELTAVRSNAELRRLLIEVTSRSILVIEDIDCSLNLTGQRKLKSEKSSDDDDKQVNASEDGSKVTLSGLLNFIDGLWSTSGEERIIVFTTNYLEKLDPALIRRGRMDKHIELSYCSFQAFKALAKNYLNLEAHPLFETINLLIDEVNITTADVAENLMLKSYTDNAEICLANLIEALELAKQNASKNKQDAVLLKTAECNQVLKSNEELQHDKSTTKSIQLKDSE